MSCAPCSLARPRVRRKTGDTRTHGFDFSDYAEAVAGQTISSVTVTAEPGSGLTIGTPATSEAVVQVEISGGVVGAYCLDFDVTWSGGGEVNRTAIIDTCG